MSKIQGADTPVKRVGQVRLRERKVLVIDMKRQLIERVKSYPLIDCGVRMIDLTNRDAGQVLDNSIPVLMVLRK